jgi:hypothetical protein
VKFVVLAVNSLMETERISFPSDRSNGILAEECKKLQSARLSPRVEWVCLLCKIGFVGSLGDVVSFP